MVLDKDEQEILSAYTSGKIKAGILSKKELVKYRKAAKATFAKSKRVNIRISAQDLEQLQLRAIEEGLPYQTLMASVLHKFLTGKLAERGDNKKRKRTEES